MWISTFENPGFKILQETSLGIYKPRACSIFTFTVYSARGCNYQASYRFAASLLFCEHIQQKRCATGIYVNITINLIHGLARSRFRSQMYDNLLPRKNFSPITALSYVTNDQTNRRGQALNKRRIFGLFTMYLRG